MSPSKPPTPTLYALLIGIDYYKPNRLYSNLNGAVRDITLVDTFLRNTINVPPAQIYRLLSPHPEDVTRSATQPTDAKAPTYKNIVKAFDTITQMAQAGEQIYIHYSGHGGRAKTVYPNLKQGRIDQTDEGIVPMDIGDMADGRYLRDVEMATLLKRMTDKGLIVTVVLDSCHSGGSTRGDAEIRGGTAIDTRARSPESLVADSAELERNWRDLSRDRAIGVAGLPQARQYVLLAACRPNEYAYEYAANGGTERYGALTYWMIDTLTSAANSRQPLTYKLLHDRVNAKVQSKFPQQMPMILGESDRRVLGRDRASTPYTVSVINVISDTQVTLNAGQVQGLSKGTRFSIYPLHTTDFTDKEDPVAIVELTEVEGADSTARVLEPEAGGITLNGKLESGAPAVMTSAPVELIQRVRFFDKKREGEQENELPSGWVNQQTQALEAVRRSLAHNHWVVEVQGDEAAHYQVAVDREGHYEINAGSPIKTLRPLLSIDESTAPQRVVDRLVHLAKYQAVQSLDNATSKLAQAIDVQLLDADGKPFDDPENLVIQAGDKVILRLTNQSAHPLKVAALDIEPTWAISQIPLGGLASPFFNLEAGAEQDTPLRVRVPDDEAYQQTTETLKVFAIQNGLADFRWLTLPPLDDPSEISSADLEAEFEELMRGDVTRSLGDPEGVNPLNDLLKLIGADLDQQPSVTRALTILPDPKQDWVTKQLNLTILK
ncbi:MAG: caspase family protein [Leptolyngbya sp. SIO1E4]|nr:caspase family protein [Leptolyngbya sp. SIO1E4]